MGSNTNCQNLIQTSKLTNKYDPPELVETYKNNETSNNLNVDKTIKLEKNAQNVDNSPKNPLENQGILNFIKRIYEYKKIKLYQEQKFDSSDNSLFPLRDLFDLSLPFLKIRYLCLSKRPENFLDPLTKDVAKCLQLKYLETIYKKSDSLLILYEGRQKHKYVLKRSMKWYSKALQNEDMVVFLSNSFIKKAYNEYIISKIFSISPNSSNPFSFNIFYESNFHVIISEILMEYAGEDINKIFPINNPEIYIELVMQLISQICLLKNYKIEHNDIKPQNILVSKILDKYVFKLIDFDIGRDSKSLQSTITGAKPISGYSYFYASPEIIKATEKMIKRSLLENVVDPWKAQIYSIGILFLEATGFFRMNNKYSSDLDNIKIDPYKHDEFQEDVQMHFAKRFSSSKNNMFWNNIGKLVNLCLEIKPIYRPNANYLYKFIQYIENKRYTEIPKFIKLLRSQNSIIQTKKWVKQEIKLLQEDLKYIKDSFVTSFEKLNSNKNQLISRKFILLLRLMKHNKYNLLQKGYNPIKKKIS